jgi:hypothetical protein
MSRVKLIAKQESDGGSEEVATSVKNPSATKSAKRREMKRKISET